MKKFKQMAYTRELAFIAYAIKELEKGDKAEDIGICLIYANSPQFCFKGDDWHHLKHRIPELGREINKVLKSQNIEGTVLNFSNGKPNSDEYTPRIKLLKRVEVKLIKKHLKSTK